MTRSRPGRAREVVGALLGGGFLLLGTVELLTRLDEPGPLLFWLPTLWGGGALVLLGVFGPPSSSPKRSRVYVIAGALLGFLPSVWTIVMPLLSVALIMLTVQETRVEEPLPAAGG